MNGLCHTDMMKETLIGGKLAIKKIKALISASDGYVKREPSQPSGFSATSCGKASVPLDWPRIMRQMPNIYSKG